ncbi:MAG: ABC transporter permease, partial [Actinomycetota bacterium]
MTITSVPATRRTIHRPTRFGPLLHFLEHQLLRFRSTFRGTVITGATGPLLYLLGIGIGIGSQVDAEASQLGTTDYLTYVGPGLMAAAAMQLAGSESLWQTGGLLKWQGVYVSLTSTPLSIGQLFTGHVLWIGFRVFVASVLFLLVLLPFGVVEQPLAILAPFAAVLTGMAFAAPISAWTGYVTSNGPGDQSFPVILRLFILPMYLFSGAFYPIEQLPEVLT